MPLPSSSPSNTTPFTESIWNWSTSARSTSSPSITTTFPLARPWRVVALKPTQSAESTRSGWVMRTLPRAT